MGVTVIVVQSVQSLVPSPHTAAQDHRCRGADDEEEGEETDTGDEPGLGEGGGRQGGGEDRVLQQQRRFNLASSVSYMGIFNKKLVLTRK